MKFKITLNQPYRGKEEYYCSSYTIQTNEDPEYDIVVFQEEGKNKTVPHAIYASHVETITEINERVVFDREPYIFLRRAYQWGKPHKKYKILSDITSLVKMTM